MKARARWGLLVLLLLGVPWGVYALLTRTTELRPVAESGRFFLPALSLALVVLTLGLAGVLIRNLVKLLVERKRGILGSGLRMKLGFFYLALVLLPAVILFTGSAKVIKDTVEAILRDPLEQLKHGRQVVDGWSGHFEQSALSSATLLAEDLTRLVGPPGAQDGSPEEALDLRRRTMGVDHVQVLGDEGELIWVPGTLPTAAEDQLRLLAPSLAARARTSGSAKAEYRRVSGELVVLAAAPAPPHGTVFVAVRIPRVIADSMERISGADLAYRQFRVQRRELVRFYLTLIGLIFIATLFVATWLGLYVARRITVPLQEVAAASREISAGNLDVRVRAKVGDEMGMLVDAFNDMAAELQENREVITRSTADLRRSNRALDERRRYIERLVANLSTAVISLDPSGLVRTANPAVEKILGVRLRAGDEARVALAEAELGPLVELLDRSLPPEGSSRFDVELPEGCPTQQASIQLSSLVGASAENLGTLVMIEDLTDVARAQRAMAWQEVARRMAHEIKNPLTPIQLAAQRLRKKKDARSVDLDRVIDESTAAIEHEVSGLKQLVDEFSRYARLPETAPRDVELHGVVRSVLSLYEGLGGIDWEVDLDPRIDHVVVDPQQIRRALINLIDNAVSAMKGSGRIEVATRHADANGSLRIEVADSGPGVPAGDRDKMFAPYFSTKKRGTGLGLAIVHKVVTDHRGTIRIEDNAPSGARFVIEIPA